MVGISLKAIKHLMVNMRNCTLDGVVIRGARTQAEFGVQLIVIRITKLQILQVLVQFNLARIPFILLVIPTQFINQETLTINFGRTTSANMEVPAVELQIMELLIEMDTPLQKL